MKWTKEKPTTPDFYWYRYGEGRVVDIAYVFGGQWGNLVATLTSEDDTIHPLELMDGDWSDTLIPEPED